MYAFVESNKHNLISIGCDYLERNGYLLNYCFLLLVSEIHVKQKENTCRYSIYQIDAWLRKEKMLTKTIDKRILERRRRGRGRIGLWG